MQNKVSFPKRSIQAFLLFMISSTFAGLLSLSFNSEHALSNLIYTTSQQAKQSKPNLTSRSTHPALRPTSTPQASPTPDFSSGIAAQDTFRRGNQKDWNSGPWQGWTESDDAFYVQNNSGYIAGQGLHYVTAQPSMQDMEVDIIGSMSSFQGATLGAVVRWVNNTTWYEASINGTQFSLIKRSSGIVTLLASMPFYAHADTTYEIQCLMFHQQLMSRIWPEGDSMPGQWQLSATDNSIQSGYGGISALTQPGSIATIHSYTSYALYAQVGFNEEGQPG